MSTTSLAMTAQHVRYGYHDADAHDDD